MGFVVPCAGSSGFIYEGGRSGSWGRALSDGELPRLRRQNKKSAPTAMRTTPMTPTAIPALAPVDRSLCGFAGGGRVDVVEEDDEEEEEVGAMIAVELWELLSREELVLEVSSMHFPASQSNGPTIGLQCVPQDPQLV
jgi:hypothetical protein